MSLSTAIKQAKKNNYAIVGGGSDSSSSPSSAGTHYTTTKGPGDYALTPDNAPIHTTATLGPDAAGQEHSPTAVLNSNTSFTRKAAPTRTSFTRAARTYDQEAFERPKFRSSQEAYVRPEYTQPEAYQRAEYTQPEAYERPEFQTNAQTDDYMKRLQDVEGQEPGAYNSRYEGAIQSILDGILGQNGPYNIKDDINYNLLYEQARESAMANGNKAMRDAMGNMQAQTGGYGSTAAQAAGSQAYDNYLQSLNEQNPALAELAYQMWRDQQADRYNQLNAVRGVDESEYARHRDTYNDWLNNRNYLANQAQQAYANDRNAYQYDTTMDWNQWQDAADRAREQYEYETNFDYNNWQDLADRAREQYEYENNFDWNQWQDTANREWDQYTYNTNMDYNTWQTMLDLAERQYQYDTGMDFAEYQDAANRDWQEYTYDEGMDYQMSRDEQSDYDNAMSQALKFAQAGMAVPSRYSRYLDETTMGQLNNLAAQATAAKAGNSGGGSGRKSSGSGGGDDFTYDWEDVIALKNAGYGETIVNNAYAGLSDQDKKYYKSHILNQRLATGR